MNNNDLMNALSGLDPKYIDEAAYELHESVAPGAQGTPGATITPGEQAAPGAQGAQTASGAQTGQVTPFAPVKKNSNYRIMKYILVALPAAAVILLVVGVTLPMVIRMNKSASSTAPDSAAYESDAAAEYYEESPAAAGSAAEAPAYDSEAADHAAEYEAAADNSAESAGEYESMAESAEGYAEDEAAVADSAEENAAATYDASDSAAAEGSEERDKSAVKAAVVPNPSWKSFSNGAYKDVDREYISLKKTSEEKTDWLDTEKWAARNGFELRLMPYSDGEYYYEPYAPVDFGYMYNSLRIYDADKDELLYDLDLHTLINGPDEERGKEAAVTEYIRWARMYEGLLYIAAGHNTYASSESESSYMIAIDPEKHEAVWRSDPLVSNALNFEIVDDTIICGYGFTAEDDYIYLLDRYDGKTVDRIRVNSGPDQFEVAGGTLYVATYNTAYTFRIDKSAGTVLSDFP